MKVQFNEYEKSFTVEMTAENMEEAAALVRFGLNSTKEIKLKQASVHQGGSFYGFINIGKKKNSSGTID